MKCYYNSSQEALVAKEPGGELGRRERQVYEAVYRLKEASVAMVLEELADAPGYSSARATMNNLVRKGFLVHRQEGRKLVYRPAIPADKARATAVKRLLQTYFEDSAAAAVSALLTMRGLRISDDEYESLSRLIEERAKEGT
jgi:BlaI family transcriptional regulator, penicillinase repressor